VDDKDDMIEALSGVALSPEPLFWYVRRYKAKAAIQTEMAIKARDLREVKKATGAQRAKRTPRAKGGEGKMEPTQGIKRKHDDLSAENLEPLRLEMRQAKR
jgi:hypothetical protein